MYFFPNDIIFEIFRFLEFRKLIKMEVLSKDVRNLIRTIKWHHIVDLSGNKIVQFVSNISNLLFIDKKVELIVKHC